MPNPDIVKRLEDLTKAVEDQRDYEMTMARLSDHEQIAVEARIDTLKDVTQLVVKPEWSKEDARQLLKKFFR